MPSSFSTLLPLPAIATKPATAAGHHLGWQHVLTLAVAVPLLEAANLVAGWLEPNRARTGFACLDPEIRGPYQPWDTVPTNAVTLFYGTAAVLIVREFCFQKWEKNI